MSSEKWRKKVFEWGQHQSAGTSVRRHLISLFFSLLGLLLLVLAYRNQDWQSLRNTLFEADYSILLLIGGVSVLGNLLRVWRWQLLLRADGRQVGTGEALAALMFGYLVNYGVPRLGELYRCGIVARRARVPFRELLGTVVAERAVDVLSLLLLIIAAFLLEWTRFEQFFQDYIWQPIWGIAAAHRESLGYLLAVGLLMLVGLVWFIFRYWPTFRRSPLFKKVLLESRGVWQGAKSVGQLDRPGYFFLLSALIWVGYFLMTYLWFFSFPATSQLSWRAGLMLMVIGSTAKSLPIQGGGMGAYHFLFAQGALLYGVSAVYGNSLALLIHGFQTLYHLLAGLLAGGYLLAFPTKKS